VPAAFLEICQPRNEITDRYKEGVTYSIAIYLEQEARKTSVPDLWYALDETM
jgi:hypothetical protein